jgi:uncharacterized protein (DUF885 family)
VNRWLWTSSFLLAGCARVAVPPPTGAAPGDAAFRKLQDRYVLGFLRRNPVVSTYLGGSGLHPSLREVDGRLRDHSATALEAEDRWLAEIRTEIERTDPSTLSPSHRIDRDVALAQIRFLLHQHRDRRYQERALDTYSEEGFRGVDWLLQGMVATGPKTLGSPGEWRLLIARVGEIPRYLEIARAQLEAGVRAKNTPDFRMLQHNGLETCEANAKYFAKEMLDVAAERIAGGEREALLAALRPVSLAASRAYEGFRELIAKTFFENLRADPAVGVKPEFRGDRFAFGATEYDWALRNNFRIEKSARELYEESWPVVRETRAMLVTLAREVGRTHGWKLPEGPGTGTAAVRKVFDQLSLDYPKSDAEMIEWYRSTAFRLVEYARRTGLFDVPADYQLEVVETPPPLLASVDGASYYPAPPFKKSGVGRFYVNPTKNDVEQLKANNRSTLADLAIHEGFPGHDWNHKVMAGFRDNISPVRWLTPGSVEDSSSMWEDSMPTEGWALYAEALMAEPQHGAPNGFYTPAERLYQLQGKLFRDLRIRIDTGIHTGRMTYAQAVDLFSELVDFLPGSCADPVALKNDTKRASCESSEKAIFRYSKWPTQAITYRLGMDQIQAMRGKAAALLGPRFSAKSFHLLFMKQGSIPAGYFEVELLRELTGTVHEP